jgi:small subunit ribosomal protein S2
MSKYIFGTRNKIHIIDLQKTLRELKKNYEVVKNYMADGKTIIFVGTKKQAQNPIKEEALRCGAYFVCDRWLGGTLTNFETLKKSIARYKALDKMKTDGAFDELSKKEQSRLEKERLKLEKSLEGLKDMARLPDLMFVVDPHEEATAVAEARKLDIPIVAVCDTNCNPDLVTYPVPGNDDAIRAVKLFCSIIADAVIEGRGVLQKTENAQKSADRQEQKPKVEAKPEPAAAPEAKPEPSAVESAPVSDNVNEPAPVSDTTNAIPQSEAFVNEPVPAAENEVVSKDKESSSKGSI